MSLGKGILLIGGTLAAASVLSSSPILSITAPLMWWGTKKVTLAAGPIAGISAAMLAGASAGKITGSTGTALMVQGLDDMSRSLVDKLSGEKPPEEEA